MDSFVKNGQNNFANCKSVFALPGIRMAKHVQKDNMKLLSVVFACIFFLQEIQTTSLHLDSSDQFYPQNHLGVKHINRKFTASDLRYPRWGASGAHFRSRSLRRR